MELQKKNELTAANIESTVPLSEEIDLTSKTPAK